MLLTYSVVFISLLELANCAATYPAIPPTTSLHISNHVPSNHLPFNHLQPNESRRNLLNQQQQQQQQQQQDQTLYHHQHHHQGQFNSNPNSHHDQSNPFIVATTKLLLDLRQQMIGRALKFDEHFRTLLSQSKLSLHNMFVDTYGLMYEHNTEIFTSMYESLEQYYATGQIKLTKSMENFFERLYQKIFQVYNSNRAFSSSYLECATEQLAHLKPFKDAPDKLIEEIRHAFVAARTFNQALNTGIDVIKSIISIGQPAQCVNLISDKLLKPSRINGVGHDTVGLSQIATRKPCLGYCEDVISSCIGKSNWEQLGSRWRAYVLSLGELAKKLSVHYNIETIIAPLDVQISEAIMNFQENAHNITSQVFQVCGRANGGAYSGMSNDQSMSGMSQIKPIPNRLGKRWAPAPVAPTLAVLNNNPNRRPSNYVNSLQHNQQYPATSSTDEFSSLDLTDQQQQQHHNSRPGSNRVGNMPGAPPRQPTSTNQRAPLSTMMLAHEMDSLAQPGKRSPVIIDEIKDYMLSTKSFWSSLPNSVCTSNLTLGLNATSASNNKRQQYGGSNQCFTEPLGLSDMNTDLEFRNYILAAVKRLDLMRDKIVEALDGNEIDWSSNNDHQQPSSSSVQQPRPPTVVMNNNKPSLVQVAPSARPTPPAIVTSTTSTLAPDSDDETSSEDDLIEPDDNGSTTEEPEPDETDATTTEIDDYYTTEEPDDEEDSTNNPSNNNDLTTEQPNQVIDDPTEKPNYVIPDVANDLITPPDQSPQRSNGSASRFVIIDQIELLFMLLNFVIISMLLH